MAGLGMLHHRKRRLSIDCHCVKKLVFLCSAEVVGKWRGGWGPDDSDSAFNVKR